MDGFSILDPLAWDPAALTLHPAYAVGNAAAWLSKTGAAVGINHYLSGRLYVSKSGWLLLSVPNALVRGVFDAMTAPGVELPLAGKMNVPDVKPELLNAHISVMTADEVSSIGASKINERGHHFHYALGPIKEIAPKNIEGISRVWAIQVASPELAALRKSYGLSALPNNDHPFHITVAVRRTNVLRNNNIGKFDAAAGRGELKIAADNQTTYDCGCSGPCMCPETCVCKKSGRCGVEKVAAAEKQQPNALSRPEQNDLLPGGKADNLPDRDFSAAALAEGAKHEHEHTDNGQVAKEIAKDHLQEDAAYYSKLKKIEKGASNVLDELRAAKEHSDHRRYDQKNAILRKLMAATPEDWIIDSKLRSMRGVTHLPTKFKLHTQPTVIPPSVKAAVSSVYLNQLRSKLNPASIEHAIRYDPNKPVFENVRDQLAEVKRRGDFILQTQRNQRIWRAQVDPKYRYQLLSEAIQGRTPQPSRTDQIFERYGDGILAHFPGGKK